MTGWLIAIGVAVAAAVAHDLWDMPVGRFFRGTPLGGKPFTDATWNYPATRVLVPVGHRDCHHHWRQRKVAAIRAAATVAAGLGAWGWIWHRTATETVLAAGAASAAAVACPRAVRRARHWQHHRTYVRPLSGGITRELGAPPQRLRIEPDRSRVVIDLDPDFTGSPGDCKAIERAVAAKVTPGLEPDWSGLGGRKPQVVFVRSPEPPPARVTLAGIRAEVDRCGPDALVAGLGKRRAPVLVSLQDDSPHLALSIGSGGGKTTGAKWLAVQVLYKGGLLVVLNAKRIGYAWTNGLPNAAQVKELTGIGEMLLWLDEERKRREGVADASVDIEDEIHANVGNRILIDFEEMNLTVPALKKIMPEAVDALGNLGFAGRQSRMHLLQIAQRYSAKAAGGGDLRATVGTRFLGRYDKDAWNMLAKAFAMPPMNNTPGRVQVVTSDVEECQMPRLTGQEAHDYALAGTVAACPADMPYRCAQGLPALAGAAQITGPDQPSALGHRPDPPPYEPDMVTLREGVDAGIFGRRSLDAIRSASKRDPLFPAAAGRDGTASTYDVDALYEYMARKAAPR